jgi:putative NADH-flavin reductase
MKLALIGATGYVGSRVLDEALERGHDVTGIVRNVDKLPTHPNLTPLRADVHDVQQVTDAVAGHDAVISCFNPGGHDVSTNPHFYRDIVEGTRTIIDGVKRSDVRRVIYVGGAGSLHLRPGLMLIDDKEFLIEHLTNAPEGMLLPTGPPSLDIPSAARIAYYLFERERDLEWTFFSPSLFLGYYGGKTGRIRYGTVDLLEEGGVPAKLDVEDLAVAIVDEVEKPRQIRGHLTVATVD